MERGVWWSRRELYNYIHTIPAIRILYSTKEKNSNNFFFTFFFFFRTFIISCLVLQPGNLALEELPQPLGNWVRPRSSRPLSFRRACLSWFFFTYMSLCESRSLIGFPKTSYSLIYSPSKHRLTRDQSADE